MQWRSFLNDQTSFYQLPPPKKKKNHPSFPENGAKRFMDKNPIAAEAGSSNLNIPRTLDVKAKQIGFINNFHQKLNGTLPMDP